MLRPAGRPRAGGRSAVACCRRGRYRIPRGPSPHACLRKPTQNPPPATPAGRVFQAAHAYRKHTIAPVVRTRFVTSISRSSQFFDPTPIGLDPMFDAAGNMTQGPSPRSPVNPRRNQHPPSIPNPESDLGEAPEGFGDRLYFLT